MGPPGAWAGLEWRRRVLEGHRRIPVAFAGVLPTRRGDVLPMGEATGNQVSTEVIPTAVRPRRVPARPVNVA